MAQIDLDLPMRARAGNVNSALGDPVDVLFVNGSSGDADRIFGVGVGQLIDVSMMASPAGPTPGCFALYVYNGEPADENAVVQRRGLGTSVFPTWWRGGTPKPRFTWNSWGYPEILGVSDFPVGPAPTTVIRYPGLQTPNRSFTFQGILQDDGSLQGEAAITNAVIVKTKP